MLGPGEDERAADRLVLQELGQERRLVRAVDEDDVLLDLLDRRGGRGDFDPNRLFQDVRAQLRDALGHGRREEQGLTLLGQQRDEPLHVGQEAHVEHPVGLVEHQERDPVEAHMALRAEIEEPSRRRHQNVEPARQRLDLGLLPDAAEHDRAAQPHVPPVSAEALAHLERELAGRRQDERARASAGSAGHARQMLQDRQSEGGGLAGAGLRETEQVAPGEEMGYGGSLDRRRRQIVLVRERAQKRLGEEEIGKGIWQNLTFTGEGDPAVPASRVAASGALSRTRKAGIAKARVRSDRRFTLHEARPARPGNSVDEWMSRKTPLAVPAERVAHPRDNCCSERWYLARRSQASRERR